MTGPLIHVKVSVDVKSNPDGGSSFEVTARAAETVAALKDRIASVSLVPFPDQVLLLDAQPLHEGSRLADCGIKEGSSLVLRATPSEKALRKQLQELLKSRQASHDELGLLYCYKHRISIQQILKALAFRGTLKDFVEGDKSFQLENGKISLAPVREAKLPKAVCSQAAKAEWPTDNQQYIDLHNNICSRAFNSKASKTLVDLVDFLQEGLFLNVARVTKGGSLGKGVGTSTRTPDAEVVLFLRNLPSDPRRPWLKPLLRACAAILKNHFEEATVLEDCVRLVVPGVLYLDLRFAPALDEGYTKVKAMAKEHPGSHSFFHTLLVEQRVQFVARQPGSVKMTIRLLKWWRDQQDWDSPQKEPSNELLELVAIHVSAQSKPKDQQEAIASAMAALSNFDQISVVWSNFYSKAEVSSELLSQRPLVMDPTNPTFNVAHPEVFDCSQLVSLARSSRIQA